jgi:hypothetical protein
LPRDFKKSGELGGIRRGTAESFDPGIEKKWDPEGCLARFAESFDLGIEKKWEVWCFGGIPPNR